MKKKSYILISKKSPPQKSVEEMEVEFMIKTLSKLGKEVNLHHLRNIIATIKINCETLKKFPSSLDYLSLLFNMVHGPGPRHGYEQ